LPWAVILSCAKGLINGRRDFVAATSFVDSTFEDDATNASAAAAAKNALLAVKRRYARIRFRFGRGVFMEFYVRAGVNSGRLTDFSINGQDIISRSLKKN